MLPLEAEFSRKIALITGGAGAIGSATARRLLAEGAHVVLADINLREPRRPPKLSTQATERGRATAVKGRCHKEDAVIHSFSRGHSLLRRPRYSSSTMQVSLTSNPF